MLVDIQIAKPQTAYKRDQLSRSFKSARRTHKPATRRARWTRAPKPSLAWLRTDDPASFRRRVRPAV